VIAYPAASSAIPADEVESLATGEYDSRVLRGTIALALLAFAVAFTTAGDLKIVRTYQRYSGEEGLAVAFGSVWTGSADGGDSIARTDISTGKSRSLKAPIDEDTELFAGPDALWQTDFGHGIVRRIDPVTNRVKAAAGFAGPAGMAFSGHRVFVALHHGQAAVELDPKTLKVLHAYRLPSAAGGVVADGPSDVAITPGSLWVDAGNLGATFRFALPGGRVRARLPGCSGPFAKADGALWASCRGRLARIDLQTTAVSLTTARGGIPAALGSGVWVAGPSSITEVVAKTGATASRHNFKGAYFQALLAADGSLWAFDANRVQVIRITPS